MMIRASQKNRGTYILEVNDDSYAEKIGLKAGEIIVEINGVDIRRFKQKLIFHLLRNERVYSLKVTLSPKHIHTHF